MDKFNKKIVLILSVVFSLVVILGIFLIFNSNIDPQVVDVAKATETTQTTEIAGSSNASKTVETIKIIEATNITFVSKDAGQITFRADVADTPALRQKGLSGREKLGEKEAMLFVFDQDAKYAFWMKDMLMSIDILWLDATKKIVHIEQNVDPSSYPASFSPKIPARYVLEVQAGTTAKYSLKVGDIARW